MNVFVVPSWYPSATKPAYGIFVKEQVEMLAKQRPSWKIGVSTWGQGDDAKLLWARDHFKNLSKIKRHNEDLSSKTEEGNISTYYQPALSWTKKFRKGNLEEIIRCNELNYQLHELESGKPDLIWVQASYPGAFVGQHLSKKLGVPYVVHVRLGGYMFEYLLSEVGRMKNDLLACIQEADQVMMTSEFQKSELTLIDQATVLPNPVDSDFFQPSRSETEGIEILSIGRLEKEKGFDLLLEAVNQVPEVNLTIGGSGSQLVNLRKLAKELNVEHRVNFAGEMNREEVRQAMRQCSFYVLPSRYETFGNVLLEAMAVGKPVVATNCGGPRDIVTQNTGYLAEVSAQGLAEQIKEMIKNREAFSSDSIRNEVLEKYSSEAWVSSLEELIRAAVER